TGKRLAIRCDRDSARLAHLLRERRDVRSLEPEQNVRRGEAPLLLTRRELAASLPCGLRFFLCLLLCHVLLLPRPAPLRRGLRAYARGQRISTPPSAISVAPCTKSAAGEISQAQHSAICSAEPTLPTAATT